MGSFGLSSFETYNKHAEYYSLTTIKYKESEKMLQITMRFFTDDLEKALNTTFESSFELNTERERRDTETQIMKYLMLHFQLKADAEGLQYRWVGKEYDKDSIYIYLEVTDVEPFHTIYVSHDAINEVYPMQENIVKLMAFDTQKTAVLTLKNTHKTFDF
ncbi:MAG: hypothetical protein CR968_04860 [Flavobacteriia bacterium]|nr:MAG: hypothetical protein CR968_04860 [Flavobacteriia bacterium]